MSGGHQVWDGKIGAKPAPHPFDCIALTVGQQIAKPAHVRSDDLMSGVMMKSAATITDPGPAASANPSSTALMAAMPPCQSSNHFPSGARGEIAGDTTASGKRLDTPREGRRHAE